MVQLKISAKNFQRPILVFLFVSIVYVASFTLAPSTYTISGDLVYIEDAEKGLVLQEPHTLTDISNSPIVNFTSYYIQPTNFDILLGFTDKSARVVSADVWENYAHEQVNQNCTDYLLNTTSQNGTLGSYISNICYPYTYSNTYFDWKPLTLSSFEYAGITYFSVTAIRINPQETKTIRPTIEISPRVGVNSGKYEILVKPSSIAILQSLTTGDQIKLDPWWNYTWRSCKNINVTDITGRNWTNTVQVNVSEISFSNTYELRVVNATCNDDNGMAQNYKVISNGTGDGAASRWAEIRFNFSNSRTTNNDNFTVWSVYYDPDNPVQNLNYLYTNSLNATFDWPRNYFDIPSPTNYSGTGNYDGYPIAGCTSRDMQYSSGESSYIQITPFAFTPNTTAKYVVIAFNINCGSGGNNMSVWYNNELVGFLDRTSSNPWQRLGNAPLNNSRLEDFAVYRRWVCGSSGGSVVCGTGGGDNQQRWFFYIPVTKYVNNAPLKINQTGNWLGIVDDIRFTNATTEEFGSSPIFEVFWNTTVSEPISISANETEARNAIELGINDTIPTSARYPDQWIYTRNLTHQRLGRFDRVAVLGNQTWAFNFQSTGEPELNGMAGVGRSVNIWEKKNLKASEIRSQVADFITATKW